MNNIFPDDFESDEAEAETTKTNLLSDELYVSLGNPKSDRLVPLAFTVPDDLPLVTVEGCTLAWSKIALENLSAIAKDIYTADKSTTKNLPYASLRGLLEVGLKNIARIQSNLGLDRSGLNYKSADEPEPFAYLTNTSEAEINKALRPIFNEWIVKFLNPFAEREKVLPEILNRLEDLRQRGELLKISSFTSHTLPWDWSNKTGTTQPTDEYAYPMLVDYVVRQLAGQEIFQGLGPIRRIISSSGILASNTAELITSPISLPNKKGTFSLVVRLEITTHPSLHQPLLKIDVSKRRWLSQLKSPHFDRNDISGFVFSQDYPERAFSYKVICKQDRNNQNNKDWYWSTDTSFEVLQRELNLPLQSFDGQQIALGNASTDRCQVMLTYRNGIQGNSGQDENGLENSNIEAGVPEIDKLEAIEAIAKILNPLGIKPFENYSQVKLGRSASHKLDNTASRTINIYTLFSAILEKFKTNHCLDFTSKYLDKLSDEQLEIILNQNFNINLKDIYKGRKSLEFDDQGKKLSDQINDLKALIQVNQEAMRRIYPNERLSLWIFYEDELQIEMKLLKSIAGLLWGETIEVLANRLPPNTHGAREVLPGKHLKAKERSKERLKAWEPIAQQIEARKQRTFCLIMARKFYPDPSGQKNTKRDDKVNKPSTRQALAAKAHACVQFLEPIARVRKTNSLKLGNFFYRLQAALKDLLSAHSGRIDDVQEKVDKYLKDIPSKNRPREILAFTIVRKQKGRARGRIENTFLAVAMRLKVDTGKCELCCAYEKGSNLAISPWSSFPDALAFIAELSPIKLADKKEVRKTRFMEFVKQIVSSSVEDEAQPLVMIDSSNCVHLWPWLADKRINASQINFEQTYEWMEQEWQGARIIRIRQDLAFGIIDKKVRELVETFTEDTRPIHELKQLPSKLKIPSASSATGLFRLNPANRTGCVTYLSVSNNRLHSYSRGQSCYRSTQTNISIKVKKNDDPNNKVCNNAGLKLNRILTRSPSVDRWPTPKPLEIVVTLIQANDNPDCLAALVESLRYSFGHYSEWTSLPAPLFFERVVRDYISDFGIDDDETEIDTFWGKSSEEAFSRHAMAGN